MQLTRLFFIRRSTKAPRVSTQCQFCEKVMETHVELFKHVMSHLDQDVVKTFPVYEEGDTGISNKIYL